MIKKNILPLFLVVLLSGCGGIMGENDFSGKIDDIEQALRKPNWKQLNSLGKDLDRLYEQNLWKIQLMGDEDEYESLQESINHLIVAIEEKDQTEIKLEIATIKTYLKDIYSL
ncbi:DUF4363 family protein [Lysinibacillus yapensis]|uniref:DUF4363 family protein n=1 Tax=Ureibacillus yapensis TaxID=2304605 RepID=A0A396S8K4_9BACL|nr:DUF4363 family protein [Lysinibacillus yapensis]RHW37415.1 DUF4363 family protein [Lysinibacillus yapensis]